MAEIRRKKVRKSKKLQIVGFIICGLQAIASVVLFIQAMKLNVLPDKYIMAIALVLFVLAASMTGLQFPKKTRLLGCILSGLFCVLFIVGNVYLGRTHMVLDGITSEEGNYKVDNIVIAVAKDDRAEVLEDTLIYNFGIHKTLDRENTDKTIATIEQQSGTTLNITEFDDFSEMIDALCSGTVQAVIYNEAYDATIEETQKDFSSKIRVLENHEITTQVTLTGNDENVTQKPFTIYISGIDVKGKINQTSRSDVNMLVTVNPLTKEVMLTTTPRDYYVQLPNVSGEYRDKLTHAGIHGVQCSMDTLSQIYNIDIDYYVRVNFTTLKNLVDALGGVDVYSEYAFTTHYKNGGYEIKKGYNHMNGKKALAFSRERYNVPGGDEQRGKDQQAVLKALLEKAMSPSILTGYMGILDSLEDYFETNMSMDQITSLVKMQLADGSSWSIKSQSVSGTFGNEYCYSAGGQRLSIMYPDEASVAKARRGILAVLGLEETIPEAVDSGQNILRNMTSVNQVGDDAREAMEDGMKHVLGIATE